MKLGFKWLVATLALVGVTLTLAQTPSTAVVSWLAPVTYVDGTALTSADLDHYTITWTASASGGPSGSVTAPANTLAANVPFPCGAANFSITVTTSSTAKYPNVTSDPSSPVLLFDSKVKCAANPPSGLGVQFSAAK